MIEIDFIDGQRIKLSEDEELLINMENIIIRQEDNSLDFYPIYRVLRISCKRLQK